MKSYQRRLDQIKEHYEIEKELANKLRNSSAQERKKLYSSLYKELFQRVPHHQQIFKETSLSYLHKKISFQMRNIRPFLEKNLIFLEVGAGDCTFSCEVSKFVKKVYALDIANIIDSNTIPQENFHFILSDGFVMPFPESSIGIVYSYQLMEHIHPDDAFDQLKNIYKVLQVGGKYICDTPNRLNGPHDISKYFDTVATGFHLKEYTITELNSLFRKVGFSKIRVHIRIKGIHILSPVLPAMLCEGFLNMLPYALRKRIACFLPVRWLLGVRLVATK